MCACRSGSKPVGKCLRCESNVCERCVTFVAGRSVCVNCARGNEHAIRAEVQMGRTVQVQRGESIIPKEDLVIRRRNQFRKLVKTLQKCFESAMFLMSVASVLLAIIFFAHIMDFFGSFAWQEEDLENPLARLTLLVAGRTNMLYFRHEAAIDHYLIFEQRYPDDQALATVRYRLGQSLLVEKEYRAALHFFQDFVERWPEHELRTGADKQIQIINRILSAAELSES